MYFMSFNDSMVYILVITQFLFVKILCICLTTLTVTHLVTGQDGLQLMSLHFLRVTFLVPVNSLHSQLAFVSIKTMFGM